MLDWYQSHLGTGAVLDPRRLTRLTGTWSDTLEAELPVSNADGEPLFLDPRGKRATAAGQQRPASRDGEPLYLAPPDQQDRDNGGHGHTRAELHQAFFDQHYSQCHIDSHWVGLDDYLGRGDSRLMQYQPHIPVTEPVCYSPSHIHDRVAEMDALGASVGAYHDKVSAQLLDLEQTLCGHLWVDQAFIPAARENLNRSLEVAAQLAGRIEQLRGGFGDLPLQA